MNKTVAIVAGSVGVLILAGVIVYFMRGDTPGEDEYSTFGFTNDAVERPVNGRKENSYEYEEEGVGEYDSEFSEISYQDGEGGGDGDGTLYERSIAGQFPVIPEPGGDSADVGTQTSPKSTVRTANTSSGGNTRTTTTDTSSDAPETFTLSIVSPKAGDVIVNDDGCPGDTELGDEEEAAPCTPEPIGRVFWNYGDPTAKMTLELFNESGTRVRTFATKTGNSGRYTWEYSPTMPNGDYKIVATAYNADGDVLTTAETGLFEVTKSGDPVIGTSVVSSVSCPPVPSKTRTYAKTYPGMSFYCTAQNGGCIDQVQLKHYRYPETVEVGKFMSIIERCGLTAQPGTRNCPYTYSNQPNAVDVNRYSIMIRDPDPTNDDSFSDNSDKKFTAYLKPIIGFSHVNDAFDFSLPIKIKESEEGKTFDFRYTVENQNLNVSGQFSISECEGDYSERSIWVSSPGDIWDIRASVLATDDLEGAKFISGIGTPILALKAGKTYYLNMRWLHSTPDQNVSISAANCFRDASGNCTSPFVRTDDLPDSAIHAHSLWRQLAADPTANYLEFYRLKFYQYNFDSTFGQYLDEDVLEDDPLFDRPGGVMLNPYLYYPSCRAFGHVHNGIRGSDCEIICREGYVVDEAKGWCVKE